MLKDKLTAVVSSAFSVFEKPLSSGWILRKYAHAEVGAPPGKGCYWDEHELDHPVSGVLRPISDGADGRYFAARVRMGPSTARNNT